MQSVSSDHDLAHSISILKQGAGDSKNQISSKPSKVRFEGAFDSNSGPESRSPRGEGVKQSNSSSNARRGGRLQADQLYHGGSFQLPVVQYHHVCVRRTVLLRYQ